MVLNKEELSSRDAAIAVSRKRNLQQLQETWQCLALSRCALPWLTDVQTLWWERVEKLEAEK